MAEGDVTLPCGDCHVCCSLKRLVVNIDNEEADGLETYFAGGEHNISKADGGQCAYLTDDGCSIYDKRPRVCRVFTCARFLDEQWDHLDAATQAETLEPLRKAARRLIGKQKRSIARRFNSMLGKR